MSTSFSHGFALVGAGLLLVSLLGENVPLLLPVATLGIAVALRYTHDTGGVSAHPDRG